MIKTYKLEDIISEKTLNELMFLKLELDIKENEKLNKMTLKEIFNFDKTEIK